MDRYDFFFRQRVTEGEMDGAFDAVESALETWRSLWLSGVKLGAFTDPPEDATESTPQDMTITIPGPLRAWDAYGRFLYVADAETVVDCSEDYQGNPTAVALAGNERWVTVVAVFDRELSDPREDGNGDTVYYSRAESVVFKVYRGEEALIGAAVQPAVQTGDVILADVLLNWNDLTIANADLDHDRRQMVRSGYDHHTALHDVSGLANFTPADDGTAATGPTVATAIVAVDDWMTGHLSGTGDHHDADTIDFDNAASGLAATEVQGALDELDGILDTAALWDTDVRFSGLTVDASGNNAPVSGDLQLWATAGQLYLRGDDGAAATAFSTLTYSPDADGGLLLEQADNAANNTVHFDVQGNTNDHAGRIVNNFDDAGIPHGLSCYVSNPTDESMAYYTRADKGLGYYARYGSIDADNPMGARFQNYGADSISFTWGVVAADESPFSEDPAGGYGFAAYTHSAQYGSFSYGAYLENQDAGANGYHALHLLPNEGTGIYSRQDAGEFFNVKINAAGELGTLTAGTSGNGGLVIEGQAGTAYALELTAETSTDAVAALLRLSQTNTGLAMEAILDPSQDGISIKSQTAGGDSAKSAVIVDFSNCNANDPVPFRAICNTHAGYSFYAEKGAFAMQSPVDTDVFTFGAHDDASWEGQYWNALLNGSPTGLSCDFVTLANDLEAPSTVLQRNAVTKRRVATAWALIDSTGSITGGHFNVTSVSKTATGVYEITLDVDGSPTGRAVEVTPSSRGSVTDMMGVSVVDPLANPIVVHLQHVVDSGAGSCAVSRVDEDFSFTVFQDK